MASFACSSYAQRSGPQYRLTDLGPIGAAGQVLNIARNGLVAGAVQQSDNTDHAVLFYGKQRLDISRPGIGGKNSLAYGVNVFGLAVGGAETDKQDPGQVDFCGFHTLLGLSGPPPVCAAFVWGNGLMAKLPTLGGNNGSASQINSFGIAAGEVENAKPDPGCLQRFQLKPVKWQGGKVIELRTYSGDPDGIGYAINDAGQVVGSTGSCSPYNPIIQTPMAPIHPMLWDADGTPTYLGTLGGSGAVFANLAININNKGRVVGSSGITGETTAHAFLWTKSGGMLDLKTLPGDEISSAVGINDSDEITGVSVSADGVLRAFIWQKGKISDLNDLIRPTFLHLLLGSSINAAGEIAGVAVDTRNGELHGFTATPQSNDDSEARSAPRLFNREDVRHLLERLKPLGRHGIRFVPER
jgi:probable HAF family extracellular repeat protein